MSLSFSGQATFGIWCICMEFAYAKRQSEIDKSQIRTTRILAVFIKLDYEDRLKRLTSNEFDG